MKKSNEEKRKIFERTDGKCHICRKTLCFSNYGKSAARGNWEIEHSNPRANGGTDYLRNLYPACITCNRSKGKNSSYSARQKNGFIHAPRSKKEKTNDACIGGILGSLPFLIAPPHLKPVVLIVGVIAGFKIGYTMERE